MGQCKFSDGKVKLQILLNKLRGRVELHTLILLLLIFFMSTPEPANINGLSSNDTLTGTSNRDIIDGWGGDDILVGLQGNDELRGNRGNDILYGGKGSDWLGGSQGNNILVGGAGNDIFGIGFRRFTNTPLDFTSNQTILDFTNNQDRLDLSLSRLTFDEISILPVANGTLITRASNGEVFATLVGVSPNLIDREDFIVRDPRIA